LRRVYQLRIPFGHHLGWAETHSFDMFLILTHISQESARSYQGASVRVRNDVPEMETFTMRLLGVASMVDLSGKYPGFYWALTSVPAKRKADNQHLPIPSARQAVIVIEPLVVIQMEVETEEAEMRRVGYVGNNNRRAVPIIVVRYATPLPGLGTSKVGTITDVGFILFYRL